MQFILEYQRRGGIKVADAVGGPVDPQVFERYRRDREIVFDQISNLLRARKIPWAMTIVPTADANTYLPLQSEPLKDELLNLGAGVGIPVFDVEEKAKAQVRATGRFLHGFGTTMAAGHLNRFGHAFFARALEARLCKFLGTLATNTEPK